MASLSDRVKKLMDSPQAQKAKARAGEMARDPKNQEKARRLLGKIQGKRR
ncbi:hypothetical protein [Actinomadura atramentaria]|nr:hypothetical protein [Actinomadura atramentaria]